MPNHYIVQLITLFSTHIDTYAMNNLHVYLEKLKLISGLFNCTLLCSNGKQIKVGNKFVFELVLEMCNNPVQQQRVLAKLNCYTSYTKEYLSGVQFKPKYFDSILKTYYRFIIGQLQKYSKTHSKQILEGFVIDFTFNDGQEEWLPSEIWACDIKISPEGKIEDVGIPGSLYGYDTIFMESIVGASTIEKYDMDGFLALLIIFINEDLVMKNGSLPEKKPNYLSQLEILAKKFNTMCSKTHNIKDFRNGEGELDLPKLVSELQPKKKIKEWMNFLISVSAIRDFHKMIEKCAMYMKENIQLVFFKSIVNSDGMIISYQKNYDVIIDMAASKIDMCGLDKYIKEIYKLSTIPLWINFLVRLVELDNEDILYIFFSIDPIFRHIFFGIPIISYGWEICKLAIESKKCRCLIKDRYYDKSIEIYHPEQNKYECVKWLYDKDLNQTGYVISDYINDDLVKTQTFIGQKFVY